MTKLTNLERETLITFNEDEQTAEVMTYNGRLIRKLLKHVKNYPEEFKLKRQDTEWGAYFFVIPKKRVNITCPKSVDFSKKEK